MEGKEKDQEKRIYETILGATPDLVYVFDLQYRFTYANKALLTMWGKTWENAVGKGLRDNGYEEWHALMHEREIDQVAATGKSVRGEVSFPHAVLGSRVYDYILVPVFNDKGKVEAVAGTTRDISEMKQAEARILESEAALANAIELAQLATWKYDVKTDLMVMSNQFAQMYGYKTLSVNLSKANSAVVESDREMTMNKFRAAIESGSGRFDAEYRITNATTGNEHIVRSIGQVFFDDSGKAVRVEGTTQDVTTQRELQLALENQVQVRTEELQATNEELATTNEELSESSALLMRSNEELSQFAYVASHDLQEPVRKISVFVELLEKSLPEIDERSRKNLDKISDSANRMLTLIRDVLTHSQISNRGSDFVQVDLNNILKDTLDEFEILINAQNCKVKTNKLPVIDAIEIQMNQLFSNLISNAMKFSKPDRKLEIEIRAEQLSDDDKKSYATLFDRKVYYRILFIDNGIGFDQTYAAQIFEIFQRLHKRSEYSGTGIGLATCKKIVLNHGGIIAAMSSPGQGATFEVILPAKQSY